MPGGPAIPIKQLPVGAKFLMSPRPDGTRPEDSVFVKGTEKQGVVECKRISSSTMPHSVGHKCYFTTDDLVERVS